jgi:hypothetical protein
MGSELWGGKTSGHWPVSCVLTVGIHWASGAQAIRWPLQTLRSWSCLYLSGLNQQLFTVNIETYIETYDSCNLPSILPCQTAWHLLRSYFLVFGTAILFLISS